MLLKMQNDAHKTVYVLASHSHYFMEGIFNTPYWKANGGILAGMDRRNRRSRALSSSSQLRRCQSRQDRRLWLHGRDRESGRRAAGNNSIQVRGIYRRQHSVRCGAALYQTLRARLLCGENRKMTSTRIESLNHKGLGQFSHDSILSFKPERNPPAWSAERPLSRQDCRAILRQSPNLESQKKDGHRPTLSRREGRRECEWRTGDRPHRSESGWVPTRRRTRDSRRQSVLRQSRIGRANSLPA